MASVTSLDKDMRKLRMDRYTPAAANEVRSFIEESLGEALKPGDLLESLKDGVALCKLVNLAAPNTIRFKSKAVMPFVQMENISMFLTACQHHPFDLQSHDVFLTVDMYESKDPAQVLQCIGAFSRAAHRIDPAKFPSPIGSKSRGAVMSPNGTGTGTLLAGGGSYGNRTRGVSNASNNSSTYNLNTRPLSALSSTKTGDSNSGRWSPTKGGTPLSPSVSSWSKKSDEGATSPAWNIAQYGYMGGASQGNLGVSFGGRRQITSAGPSVPSMAEKEKKRREKEAEDKRLRTEAEEAERRHREAQYAEEEKARVAEEQRVADELKNLRERERQKAEDEKRQWEEDERRWKLEEERRQHEEKKAEARLDEERNQIRASSNARLHGQFLSQYQLEHEENGQKSDSARIKELEHQLEMAREREREYERDRQAKLSSRHHQALEDHDLSTRLKEQDSRSRSGSHHRAQEPSPSSSHESWREDERAYLRKKWASHHTSNDSSSNIIAKSPRPLPQPSQVSLSQTEDPDSRPVPTPAITEQTTSSRLIPSQPLFKQHTGSKPVPAPSIAKQHTGNSRPLPNPADYVNPAQKAHKPSPSVHSHKADRDLASDPASQALSPQTNYASKTSSYPSSSGLDVEDSRSQASAPKVKTGGWASKSLLEREMELERQRQQEWEEGQKEVKTRFAQGNGVDGIGGGIGGKWDVNQWTGYTGGDGQNRGSQGIGSGRRQIVGPRPPPPGR